MSASDPKEFEETEEMFDDSFDDSPKDEVIDEEEIIFDEPEDQFEEGESLVGEKYVAPIKEDKFIDVHKGVVIDKKEVSPLLQIKSFFETHNIKIQDPKSGCRRCYGRGYTGFEIKSQTYFPCNCLFPAQTQNQRDNEANKIYSERKMSRTPAALRETRKWLKKAQQKIIHKKSLELLKKNKEQATSALEEING